MPDGLARDITERKRAEGAQRASEQRFRQVTEAIDEVFWLTDAAKLEVIYVSPAYEKVFGLTCESLYADPDSWLDLVHAEDRPRVAHHDRHRRPDCHGAAPRPRGSARPPARSAEHRPDRRRAAGRRWSCAGPPELAHQKAVFLPAEA